MTQPKFPELPVDVQVALINAAEKIASAKIRALSGSHNPARDWFKEEYIKICDALYNENRGHQ